MLWWALRVRGSLDHSSLCNPKGFSGKPLSLGAAREGLGRCRGPTPGCHSIQHHSGVIDSIPPQPEHPLTSPSDSVLGFELPLGLLVSDRGFLQLIRS